MLDDDKEAQRLVEEALGVRPCLWQIRVVRKILVLDNVITIAAIGSGKSFTYWMPLLFVKHGIVVLVTPPKLLGKQFKDVLAKNAVSAVSATVANATNELFEVSNISSVEDREIYHTIRALQRDATGSLLSVLNYLSMTAALRIFGARRNSWTT
jgi:superfamily II DNA helicase RecQ